MKINGNTRISHVIKENEDAIDAIASVNPHFKKLKNPALRKILAPRVTISDAAKIGKCKVEDIFAKLSAIGFEIEQTNEKENDLTQNEFSAIIQESISSRKIKILDVRPILESGSDPFKDIMETVTTLPEGYALELINTFEPVPLIKIMEKRGFVHSSEWSGDVIHVFFAKVKSYENSSEEISYRKVSLEELNKLKKHFADRLKEIDVRDLEMPLPMTTILGELESLPEGFALFVNHKKVPQYLLPELANRKFQSWVSEIADGDVKMLIHR